MTTQHIDRMDLYKFLDPEWRKRNIDPKEPWVCPEGRAVNKLLEQEE